jgi:hypothetical protein
MFIQTDTNEVFRMLSKRAVFTRGLPEHQVLQDPMMSQVFHELIHEGSITIDTEFVTTERDKRISYCHKCGWLYCLPNDPIDMTRKFVFASPLHKRCLLWMLLGQLTRGLNKEMLQLLAFAVIRKFSSLNITKRHIYSTFQSIPEAQFQDEFDRACSSHMRNSAVSFPEFGTKHGRIDFFILP